MNRVLLMSNDPGRIDSRESRERRTRRAVRVLLVDDRARILLFEDSDRAVDIRWWMTPGGGIDPGESELQAGVRELFEETGLSVDERELLGPIAIRTVLHGYSDHINEQQEAFYVVRVPAFEVDITGHSDDEKLTVLQHRWWSVSELATATDSVWPANLLDLLAFADAPDRWPVMLERVEESSVPVE